MSKSEKGHIEEAVVIFQDQEGEIWFQDAPPKSKKIQVILVDVSSYAKLKSDRDRLLEACKEAENDHYRNQDIMKMTTVKKIQEAISAAEGEKHGS